MCVIIPVFRRPWLARPANWPQVKVALLPRPHQTSTIWLPFGSSLLLLACLVWSFSSWLLLLPVLVLSVRGFSYFFIPKKFRCWRLSLPAAPKGKEEDPKAVRERWSWWMDRPYRSISIYIHIHWCIHVKLLGCILPCAYSLSFVWFLFGDFFSGPYERTSFPICFTTV